MPLKKVIKLKKRIFRSHFGWRQDMPRLVRLLREQIRQVLYPAVIYHKVCDHWIIKQTQKCHEYVNAFEGAVMVLLEEVFDHLNPNQSYYKLWYTEGPFVNEEELLTVKKAADLLDQFEKEWDDPEPLSYASLKRHIHKKSWINLIKAARKAYGLMEKNDKEYLKYLPYIMDHNEVNDESWTKQHPGLICGPEKTEGIFSQAV